MLKPGPALKVSVHLNEDVDSPGGFLHDAVLNLLQEHAISGATVYRPYAGFGSHGRLHTTGAGPVRGEHLPVLILFVEEEPKIRALLPQLLDLVTDGLVEMHPTEILKGAVRSAKVI